MASTKEKADAYAYEGRRQVTSLLRGTDEASTDPRRRINRATVGGVVLGVLALAAFGVAGRLGAGGGQALPDTGAVLVGDTGDRYVVRDGILHPALNLSSALLVGGGELTEVKPEALRGKRHGLPVGIPDAPDALPAKEHLTDGPWTACTVETGGGPRVDLTIGAGLSAGDELGEREAVVVGLGDDRRWLLTGGRRYLLADNTMAQLDLQRATQVTLPEKVLETVPEGAPISVAKLPGTGGAGGVPGIPGNIGDLVQSKGEGVQSRRYVIQQGGLTPISRFVFELLVTSGNRKVREAALADATAAQIPSVAKPGHPSWPQTVPEPVPLQRNQPLCVSSVPGDQSGDVAWAVRIGLPQRAPHPDDFASVDTKAGDISGVLASVTMARGSGAVVKATGSGKGDVGYFLVTDAGMRYPMVNADAARRLRYDPKTMPTVPQQFVTLLPTGPVLDPATAAHERPGD